MRTPKFTLRKSQGSLGAEGRGRLCESLSSSIHSQLGISGPTRYQAWLSGQSQRHPAKACPGLPALEAQELYCSYRSFGDCPAKLDSLPAQPLFPPLS